MSNRDVLSKTKVLDIYTELYDNVVSKIKGLDIYIELYNKYAWMFMQALFKTFYNITMTGMEVTVTRRNKDDDYQ